MPASPLPAEVHRAGDITAAWAEARVTDLLDGAPENITVPAYGSPSWLDLPAGHALKSAAVLTAAETWRREELAARRLDALMDADPDAWFREVTAEADRHAARLGPLLAATPTRSELAARRAYRTPHQLTARPGWGPVRVPGRPGWWRHDIDGEQVDLPTATPARSWSDAA